MDFGAIALPTGIWILVVSILALISWFIFYISPVVIKTTVGFAVFSLVIFTASVWVGSHTLKEFVSEWSEYEVSRIKEGAFTFIERRKSDQRNLIRRFVDESEKIMEDKFAKTVLDYIAISDLSGNILQANRKLELNIARNGGELEQGFYKTNDGVYLVTVVRSSAGDKLIIIGEKAEIRLLPALQAMLSIKDVFIETEERAPAQEESVLRNAEMKLGENIKLVMVPNYDLVFELVAKLATGASRGIGIAILFAVIFFGMLSILYIRRPLIGLILASKEVEKGNFEYEISYRPKGDIGKVVETFNNMTKGLRRRDAQIKYRNELLSAIKEFARSILSEYDKEKIFELCVDVAGVKTGSKCAIFYGDNKVRYSEKPEIQKDEIEGIRDGEVLSKNGNFTILYQIAAQKEEGKIVYGSFVAQRDRDFTQEEKEFFLSLVNYAASACLRSDYVMKLRLLQSTDSLTGLFNSTFFKSSIKREISMLQRFQRNFGLVFIDIENSSEIIDKFGNIVWEDLIKAIAMVMKKSVRTYDIPARLGNDKFALLLPNTTVQNAKVVENRLREVLKSAPEVPSLPEIEIKINISSTATDVETTDEIISKVDERISVVQESVS